MKKINSNGYAHKIIGLAALFLFVIPLCLFIFRSTFHIVFFSVLIYLSLVIGIMITLFFIGLLSVELHQDKKIDRQYAELRKKKLPLGNGKYECQACGNRQVSAETLNCNICGIRFTNERSPRL